jgi:hypothetical protein
MDYSAEADQTSVEEHVVAQIDRANAATTPFSHLYVDGIFPTDFYAEMLRHIPAREAYKRITETGRTSGHYEERLILHLRMLDALTPVQRAFWQEFGRWFVGSELASALIRKFHAPLADAIGMDLRRLDYGAEGMLVKDLDGYQIGPHTDVRNRAISVMFYLPADNQREPFGTSLYVPRDPSFRSDGSKHFGFDGFEKVSTAPYRANAMFGFPRTDTSFHGVEPIRTPGGFERDVLLYILRWKA